MFQFLNTLFSLPARQTRGKCGDLIEEAIDRVIEGTDRRLQAVGGCRRRLRSPVEKAVMHVVDLVDALSEPVEISRSTFSSDPRLRAFFASYNHMQEKVGLAKTMEAYLTQASIYGNSRIYGLLSMQREEKNRLGTVLQDDHIQREVQQVVVNFTNHNFLEPSVSLEETVLNVKKRAFDFMIEICLERIIAERTRYAQLEQQQHLLKRKLKAMRAGNWGLEEMLRPEKSGNEGFNALESEIESIENELSMMSPRHEVLDRNLEIIAETLGRPEELLALRTIQLELDSMNIKADASTSAKTSELVLTEVYSGIGAARILLPGWYPVDELPDERKSIADAMRYL
jgi:hypothetical protein